VLARWFEGRRENGNPVPYMLHWSGAEGMILRRNGAPMERATLPADSLYVRQVKDN
jgi:hypothetical protein